MLVLLSPAKTLDFESACPPAASQPRWIDQAAVIAAILKKQTPPRLKRLMGISDSLAELNHQRFQDWCPDPTPDQSRAAIFAFRGDVYQTLRAETLTAKQLDYAQDHLRLISGLYGILRPLDAILPYRLEMGTSMRDLAGKDLYALWSDPVTESVADDLQATRSRCLLNLASNEYGKAVRFGELGVPVIAPVFRENKDGRYRTISYFAKRARGEMARWVIREKVRTAAKLTRFSEDGYRYDEAGSTPDRPLFLRG